MLAQSNLAARMVAKSFVSMYEISFVVAEVFPVSKIVQGSFRWCYRRKWKENMTDARIFKQQKKCLRQPQFVDFRLFLAQGA